LVFNSNRDYYPLGFWDQPALLSQLRHSILKSLVARKCLRPETAGTMESWPLDRSGFSAFVGSAINQPADRPRLERVLRYIFRPSLPLKHLHYRESTGQVTYSQPGSVAKIWSHASDFLAYVTPALCDPLVRFPKPSSAPPVPEEGREKRRGHLSYPRHVGRLSYQTIIRFPTLFESRGSRTGVQGR